MAVLHWQRWRPCQVYTPFFSVAHLTSCKISQGNLHNPLLRHCSVFSVGTLWGILQCHWIACSSLPMTPLLLILRANSRSTAYPLATGIQHTAIADQFGVGWRFFFFFHFSNWAVHNKNYLPSLWMSSHFSQVHIEDHLCSLDKVENSTEVCLIFLPVA